MRKLPWQVWLASTFLVVLTGRPAFAQSITLRWDANPPAEDVVGYVVYAGTAAGVYSVSYDVGSQTSFVYSNPVAGQRYYFAVKAYNAGSESPFSAEVSAYGNAPPTLVNPGNRLGAVGESVTFTLSGSDPEGQPLSYGATGLPPGITLAAATGVVSGATTGVGSYNVTVSVSDGVLSVSQSFTWTVDSNPPALTIMNPTTASTYMAVSSSIALAGTASDDLGIASITWANDRGGVGNATGTTSWTIPSIWLQPGANVITVTAADVANRTTTDVLTVTYVLPPTVSFTYPTTASTYTTTASVLFLVGIAEDDTGVTSVTWANDRGGNGSATYDFGTWAAPGIALQPGFNAITVTAWDTEGASGSNVMTVKRNRSPVVTNPGTQTGYQGVALSLAMTATDADGDSLTWSASNLPPGLAINTSTGVITGTPSSIGSSSSVVTASDGTANVPASFTWNVVSPLPAAAAPIAPVGTTTSTAPTFSWDAVSNASYYLLWIDDVATGTIERWFTPAQANCSGSPTCSVVPPSALAAGLVSWQVLTWNVYGYGPWSVTADVIVDLADATIPTPTLGGPAGPISTRTPSYAWDPVSGAMWYQLTVTDAQGTVREFWYTPVEACAATPCSVTPNVLLAIGPAQWKLRAWRATGAGAWSDPVAFETVDAAPGKATLVAPVVSVSTSTPSFTWNAVLGTSYYLLRLIDRDGDSIERWYRPSSAGCPLGTGTCTVSLGMPIDAGLATWDVLTWNGSGYGPWSDPRSFAVELPDASAGVPQPISPTGTVAEPHVTYTWTAISGAISYRLSIRQNGGAAQQWWFTPATAACAAGGECSGGPQVDLASGTADWEVQAWTATGHGNWSELVNLTVSIGAPSAPVLVSPAGTATSTPSFVWNPSAAATYYYVRVTDSGGLRVERWLTPASVGCGTGSGTCTYSPGVTLNAGAASWEAIAWNPRGYSAWSSTVGFTVP